MKKLKIILAILFLMCYNVYSGEEVIYRDENPLSEDQRPVRLNRAQRRAWMKR